MLRSLSISLLLQANAGRSPAPAPERALDDPKAPLSNTAAEKGWKMHVGLAAVQGFHRELRFTPLKTPSRVRAIMRMMLL